MKKYIAVYLLKDSSTRRRIIYARNDDEAMEFAEDDISKVDNARAVLTVRRG